MAGRKTFTSGEILTAADVNSFLMDQSVMVFADSTARGSAIPSPSEGMTTYLQDVNQLQVYDGSSFGPVGSVLQVVRATDTTKRTVTSTSFVDTGMSVSITPKLSSSLIYVYVSVRTDVVDASSSFVTLGLQITDSSNVAISGAEDSRVLIGSGSGVTASIGLQATLIALDSPASTSTQTYKLRFKQSSGTGVALENDVNTGQIIAIEVAT